MALNIHQCPLRNSGPCPLVHCCFLTTHLSFLHSLPSLMNNCLNLLFGTQERTLMPNESYFLQTERQAEERICNREGPIGNCSDLVLAWAPLVIKGQLNRRKTNKRLVICIPPVYMCICVSMSVSVCVWVWVYVCACVLSLVWLFANPWIVPHQAPLSMEYSRKEYWIGWPFPTSSRCSQRRDQTHVSCVSCIGRQILYH